MEDKKEAMVALSNSDGAEKRPKGTSRRAVFSSQMDFIMISIGGVVGLGNIWRFPFLCYKNGGGAFLIPYFIAYIFASAPVYILEVVLGQYTTSGCVKAWNLVPAFKGLGYASQVIVCYCTICYNLVAAWAFYYLAMSLNTQLPWASCGNSWNTNSCFVPNDSIFANCSNTTIDANCTSLTNSSLRKDAVEEFFERKVLSISDGLEYPGKLVTHGVVSLLVAWIVVYFCVFRGIKWSGKIAYFTALYPYVILTVFTIRGVTLDGASTGIKFYLKPDFSRLLDSQVWIDAGAQVMFSLGVGLGFSIMTGGYNTFNTKCIRNSMVVIVVNCLTSLYGGFAVFSVLGFMAKSLGKPIDQVVKSGPGLVFLAHPKALTQMPLAPLWSALFFTMVIFVALDSQFLGVESFMTPVMDAFPKTLNKVRHRMIVIGVFCIIGFLVSLPMVTEGGIYVFRLLDYYAVNGMNLLLIAFAESIVIGWIFGADKFYDAIELMIGRRYSPLLKICWQYTAPVVVLGILLYNVIQFRPLKYGKTYDYPLWSIVLGIMFLLSSTMCIPVTFLVHWFRARGSVRQRWREITTPVLKDHQIHGNWLEYDQRGLKVHTVPAEPEVKESLITK